MNILVVNDDGVSAEGIKRLALAAKKFGNVYVVAPDNQCSAMSHRITVFDPIVVKKYDFSVEGVMAYSLKGTPADCVKLAIYDILPVRPDIVFSGINLGYNTGIDTLYSGTVGAAMEALINKVPAIAFSVEMNGVYDTVDSYIDEIISNLLKKDINSSEIWNVNFPGCKSAECKGILEDRIPSKKEFYSANYTVEHNADDIVYTSAGVPVSEAEAETDIKAVLDRYISIGKLKNNIV